MDWGCGLSALAWSGYQGVPNNIQLLLGLLCLFAVVRVSGISLPI